VGPQTLSGHQTEFDFILVEPTPVFGCVVHFQTAPNIVTLSATLRLRELLPPGPHSRPSGKGCDERLTGRKQTTTELGTDIKRALEWPPPSILLARSSAVGAGRFGLDHRRPVNGGENPSRSENG